MAFQLKGQQPVSYTFKEPVFTINFGTGNIQDLNTESLYNYRRVPRYCPTDGHYVYTAYTDDCFRGDWVTLPEDHTPGDIGGNMMIVNASPVAGTFLTTTVNDLKGGTTYEFSVWMLNVCKPTDKCPFPLLPNIAVLLQRPDGKLVAEFSTGELTRRMEPQWTRYQLIFTTTPSEKNLILTMIDNAPGGCGNDFALDDISFRERIVIKPELTPKTKTTKATPKTKSPVVTGKPKVPVVVKKESPPPVPVAKKEVVLPPPKKPLVTNEPVKPKDPPVVKKVTPKTPKITETAKASPPPLNDPPEARVTLAPDTPVVKTERPAPAVLPPPPPLVSTRENLVTKRIETEAGEIKVDLYDNGQVDGDTISVFHNNQLLVGKARLSEKAISFRIKIDPAHPHHELVMVAHNLGSIPPNTSLMVVTMGTKRYEVFISSTEQKNGKVIIDLKE